MRKVNVTLDVKLVLEVSQCLANDKLTEGHQPSLLND